jgi:hypothetical protein
VYQHGTIIEHIKNNKAELTETPTKGGQQLAIHPHNKKDKLIHYTKTDPLPPNHSPQRLPNKT